MILVTGIYRPIEEIPVYNLCQSPHKLSNLSKLIKGKHDYLLAERLPSRTNMKRSHPSMLSSLEPLEMFETSITQNSLRFPLAVTPNIH